METRPFITLDNTTVRLRDRLFLQDISWQMNSNEHWAILGPNGSGKTTFAKSLFGAVPVVRGHIIYNFSKEDRQNPTTLADTIGYVAPELHRDIIEREDLKDDFREFSGNINEITTVKDIILNKWVESADGALAEKILGAVSEITDKPVRLLLNTHWHFDHTDGNENIADSGAIIVAHENVRKKMKNSHRSQV